MSIERNIAEEVMGWEDIYINHYGDMYAKIDRKDRVRSSLPGYGKFSTNIEAAWAIVEKMKESDFWWSATYQTGLFKDDYNKPGFQVEFRHIKDICHSGGLAIAETLPIAICEAALKAIRNVSVTNDKGVEKDQCQSG